LGHMRQLSLGRTLLAALLVCVSVSGLIAIYFLYPLASPSRVVEEGGAAIINALSESNPNQAFEQDAGEYLTEVGMYVDVYNSSAVSVQFMKSLPAGYDLIVFRVHSGTGTHGVFYFTSEPYDESKYQPEQYRGELRPAKDYEGHPQVFAFGAEFVDTYLQGRFHGAIIIGMGCFGVGTSYGTDELPPGAATKTKSNLADAFIRQGALAVIGWDKLVSLSFSDQATLRLLKALAVEGMSVREAVEVANQAFGSDPIYESRLVFYPEEGGDSYLHFQTQTSVLSRLLLMSAAVWMHDSLEEEERGMQTVNSNTIPAFQRATMRH